MILDGLAHPPNTVNTQTPLAVFGGVSDAVAAECGDGRRWVVKGRQVGRRLVADQEVGRLGALMSAPVAEVGLVDVPVEPMSEGSYMEHFETEVGHGSVFIPNCIDARDIRYEYEDENMERFAHSATLYGWMGATDHQFLYRKTLPRVVYSADHGELYPEALIGRPIRSSLGTFRQRRTNGSPSRASPAPEHWSGRSSRFAWSRTNG